ncbi:MAG: nitrile hydratase accessory protein [Candidatus Binataceae bacterium]
MSDRRFRELAAELGIEEASVFSAPWEARAFAIALRLSEVGFFSWDEFRARLIREVGVSDRIRERDGTTDHGEYYEHFVRALEAVVTEKGIASRVDLAAKLMEMEAPASQDDHEY